MAPGAAIEVKAGRGRPEGEAKDAGGHREPRRTRPVSAWLRRLSRNRSGGMKRAARLSTLTSARSAAGSLRRRSDERQGRGGGGVRVVDLVLGGLGVGPAAWSTWLPGASTVEKERGRPDVRKAGARGPRERG